MKRPIERLDMLARVLAGENISVRYDVKAHTAMFNVEDRVLTCPEWQNISRNIHILFIAHEVSHALHTSSLLIDMAKSAVGEDRFDFRILNIVEDVRIENLICLKYPKLTPFFTDGYMDLIEREFWSIPDGGEDVNFPFEERINLQAKLRRMVSVDFTDEEQEIYDFLQSMRTEGDCIAGYVKVMDYLEKDPNYTERRDEANAIRESIMNGLSSLSDFLKGNPEGTAPGNGTPGDGDLVGDVVGAAISAIADESAAVGMSRYSDYPATLSTHKIVPHDGVRPFNDKDTVTRLVTEFLRRQNAIVSAKTSVHVKGDIAPNLLHKFAYTDDIFRTSQQTPKMQSHGVTFLIDISGSMKLTIRDVCRRVAVLTDFCDRVRIPYVVYGFTSNQSNQVYEFYHHRMPKRVRNGIICALTGNSFPINMGATPLSSCMTLYADLVKKFRAENGLDLVTSILLTDGGEIGAQMTNYYGKGYFVESSEPAIRAEIMNKHLRDVGINTIHHHIGQRNSYPFRHVIDWKTDSNGMSFSESDEFFGLRIIEPSGISVGKDERMYARMIATTINSRI